MSGEIRRESFADEASWLEFQANQLALARHKRQRQATQQYATAGRDYDIIKHINRRIKQRNYERHKYWHHHEKVLAKHRRAAIRFYASHAEVEKMRVKLWRKQNREWYLHQKRLYNAAHREERRAYERNYRARKRAEKLAAQQQEQAS